jgi:hypothetical protein
MDAKQQKDLELITVAVKAYIMGLYIQQEPSNYLSGTYYVSVPKDGVKTILGEPAVYGEELAKLFKDALKNYGVECVVKYKIRDEYWTTDDAEMMYEALREGIQDLNKQNSGYNSL